MVCYAFDDYPKWTKPYGAEVYLDHYRLLLSAWNRGLEQLRNCKPTPILAEMQAFAGAAYAHFTSDALQTEFSVLKSDVHRNKARLMELLDAEEKNPHALLRLVHSNAAIGFETSNQYFYTDRNLIETVLCMKQLRKQLQSMEE